VARSRRCLSVTKSGPLLAELSAFPPTFGGMQPANGRPYRSSGASLRVGWVILRLANIVPPPGATVLPGRFLGGFFGTSGCFGGLRELGANAKADPKAFGEMDRRPAADRFNGARRDR
jgi:hypothetical protein